MLGKAVTLILQKQNYCCDNKTIVATQCIAMKVPSMWDREHPYIKASSTTVAAEVVSGRKFVLEYLLVDGIVDRFQPIIKKYSEERWQHFRRKICSELVQATFVLQTRGLCGDEGLITKVFLNAHRFVCF